MKIMVIPDGQVKPGVNIDHFYAAGVYAADKKPDVIVFIGDHFDLPSLSSYDKGKKDFEGRRYLDDIEAGCRALDLFLEPIQKRRRKNKGSRLCDIYQPRLVFTIGNHEQRIERAVNVQPELEGVMSYKDLGLESRGFEVYDFLEIVVIEGVAFSHYFVSGVMGRPVGNAKLLLQRGHMSSVMGHVQDVDIAFMRRRDGRGLTGIFAGIFYTHYEKYLGPQANSSWRGVWMLHEVKDGQFDHMMVSVDYLMSRLEKKKRKKKHGR